MSGHLSAQQISGYRQGSLTAAELLAVGDHLAVCAACRGDLSNGNELPRAFVALSTGLQAAPDQETDHLPPELLAAYVDGQLDEVNRAIANRHLAHCPECQTETFDLRGLRTLLAEAPAHSEVASPPTPAPARFATLRRLPAPWVAVQAAAIVLLIVWAAMIPVKRRLAELTGQISDLQQQNHSLEQRLAALNEPQDQSDEPTEASGESANVSPPSVALNDGGALVTLDAEGRLTGLKSLRGNYEELIKTALTDQRVKMPALIAELAGGRGTLMSAAPRSEGFSLLSPLGVIIETDRPTFTWRPLVGATSYSVAIYDSGSKQVAVSPRISETEWTPAHALERGALYAWEVTAVNDGSEVTAPVPPVPPARFKVLERAKLGELAQARRMYSGSHLVMGILFAQAGLLNEAERELKQLVAANPDSVVVRNLLRSARALKNSVNKE